MKMARIALSPWQRGPCLIFTWSCSFRPCSCENHSGNFPLGVVSFLTRTRTKISFFLIKILPLLRVLKVLLLHTRSKLSKLLSSTFVPFGVSYMEASGSHSVKGEPHTLLILEQRSTGMRLYQGTIHHSQKTGFVWDLSSRKFL